MAESGNTTKFMNRNTASQEIGSCLRLRAAGLFAPDLGQQRPW